MTQNVNAKEKASNCTMSDPKFEVSHFPYQQSKNRQKVANDGEKAGDQHGVLAQADMKNVRAMKQLGCLIRPNGKQGRTDQNDRFPCQKTKHLSVMFTSLRQRHHILFLSCIAFQCVKIRFRRR